MAELPAPAPGAQDRAAERRPYAETTLAQRQLFRRAPEAPPLAGDSSKTGVGSSTIVADIQYLNRKEINQEVAINAQKQTIKDLKEKMETQEKTIKQLSGKVVKLGQAEMKAVTDAIMNRLQKELHLERQRRGLL